MADLSGDPGGDAAADLELLVLDSGAGTLDVGGVITLPILRKHYALLRSRILLAETSVRRGGLGSWGQSVVGLGESHMHSMAERTVYELLARGLLEEALSLLAAFSLSTQQFVTSLTLLCLSAHSAPKVYDDLGAETDPWLVLKGWVSPPGLACCNRRRLLSSWCYCRRRDDRSRPPGSGRPLRERGVGLGLKAWRNKQIVGSARRGLRICAAGYLQHA